MNIEISVNQRVKKIVDIEFPIYREQHLDNSTIYMKVESINKQVNIHYYFSEDKVEIEIARPTFWGSEDYLLGLSEYKSSALLFNKAIESAKSILSKCCE